MIYLFILPLLISGGLSALGENDRATITVHRTKLVEVPYIHYRHRRQSDPLSVASPNTTTVPNTSSLTPTSPPTTVPAATFNATAPQVTTGSVVLVSSPTETPSLTTVSDTTQSPDQSTPPNESPTASTAPSTTLSSTSSPSTSSLSTGSPSTSFPSTSSPSTSLPSTSLPSTSSSSTGSPITTPMSAESSTAPSAVPPVSTTTTRPAVTTVLPNIITDDHDYYEVSYYSSPADYQKLWIDLDSVGGKETHISLSNAHRLAVSFRLNFNFLYYGEALDTIVIATGGFLYTSKLLHSLLSYTQYIAPLMGNFNTSIGVDSQISYAQNDSVFVAQWDNVVLNDQPELGSFSFQVSLFKGNGTIVFAYKDVPSLLEQIDDTGHLTHVGLADAYYRHFQSLVSIFEYHSVQVKKKTVRSNTAIVFRHKLTCNMLKGCDACTNTVVETFDCIWCNATQTCSSLFDRNRHAWFVQKCPVTRSGSDPCFLPTTTTPELSSTTPTIAPTTYTTYTYNTTSTPPSIDSPKSTPIGHTLTDSITPPSSSPLPIECPESGGVCPPQKSSGRVGGNSASVGIAVALCLVALGLFGAIGFWVYYAYTHPESRSGQCLIQNRPSQIVQRVKFWKKDSEDKYKVEVQPMD